jgi:hypothetical protein
MQRATSVCGTDAGHLSRDKYCAGPNGFARTHLHTLAVKANRRYELHQRRDGESKARAKDVRAFDGQHDGRRYTHISQESDREAARVVESAIYAESVPRLEQEQYCGK